MRNLLKIIFIILSIISTNLPAQQATEINPELLNKPWTAKWISYPNHSNSQYGVYLFRKEITIKTKPNKYIVHILQIPVMLTSDPGC
jgi:alpha-L-rhamnosidase